MRLFAALCLALSLLPRSAQTGFFYQDRYEPPSPHFLTPYAEGGVMLGSWGSSTLAEDRMSGPAANLHVGGQLLLLPLLKAGARVGYTTLGASRSDGDGTVRQGLRQRALWLDASAELALPWMRLYAFHSLVGASRVRGPVYAYDEPGVHYPWFTERTHTPWVRASYRHAGVGIVPRYIAPAKRSTPGTQTGGAGLMLEVRRTWMQTNTPVDYAPNEAAGWMVTGTVFADIRANAWKSKAGVQ